MSEISNIRPIRRRRSSALEHTSYSNPSTGEILDLTDRLIIDKEDHADLQETTDFFVPTSKLPWNSVDGKNVKFAVHSGVIDKGVIEIEPGGIWDLHWHKESEQYFVFSGRGIFTVGNQEMDIDGDIENTVVIIPGNVPHQVYNPFTKPLRFFYFFPEGEKVATDITYFFPDGRVLQPGDVNPVK